MQIEWDLHGAISKWKGSWALLKANGMGLERGHGRCYISTGKGSWGLLYADGQRYKQRSGLGRCYKHMEWLGGAYKQMRGGLGGAKGKWKGLLTVL